VNKRLTEQARADLATRPAASPIPAALVTRPGSAGLAWLSSLRWKTWLTVFAALFGLYVFGGPFFLQEKYQWGGVRAQVTAVHDKTVIIGTTPAKAAEAAAITAAAEKEKVQPTIETAIGVERAKVIPAVEIAASAAAIEVSKQAAIARVIADFRARELEATAYQSCMNDARSAATAAGASNRHEQGHTAADAAVLALIAFNQAAIVCERFKPQRDAARDAAEAIAKP
jgi:hypothetical protein